MGFLTELYSEPREIAPPDRTFILSTCSSSLESLSRFGMALFDCFADGLTTADEGEAVAVPLQDVTVPAEVWGQHHPPAGKSVLLAEQAEQVTQLRDEFGSTVSSHLTFRTDANPPSTLHNET
jgi:hypothetical protein